MSWFQFQLRDLFCATLVVGLLCGWWWQYQRAAEQEVELRQLRWEVACRRVKEIVRSDLTDAEKAEALKPYVKPGDSWMEVNERLGAAMESYVSTGCSYFPAGICVKTNKDGMVTQVGYYENTGGPQFTTKWLTASDADSKPSRRDASH